MTKIAVFCPNLIGDTVMATPTFRAIRRAFPAARIVGIIKPHVAPTLDGTPWFDEIFRLDHKSHHRGERTTAVIARLFRERFDVAVLLPNSFRSALIALFAGIPRRVGFDKSGRGLFLTDRLRYPTDSKGNRVPTPIVESYIQIARTLGCDVLSLRLELATTTADETAADQVWGRLGLGGRPIVCLNNGGAYGPAKAWPETHFATLAKRLADEALVDVLLLCGPAEQAAARRVVALANHPHVQSLADETLGVGLSKACVRRARLLITTDSGPRHFAAAFGTPVITLFGPTHMAWTRTNHPQAWHISHPLPCGPCQQSVCPEGHHRCMRDLLPDDVFHAAVRVLEPSRSVRNVVLRRDLANDPNGTHIQAEARVELI